MPQQLFRIKAILQFAALLSFVCSDPNADRFNYEKSDFYADDFGPKDWDLVRCDSAEQCTGWPTNWKEINDFIPFEGTANSCRDCSRSNGGICFKHRQSPIDLLKNVTWTSDCADRHRMRYWAGECRFNQMEFEILPHVLRAYQPSENCSGAFQPQIDFSKGFPAPWLLSHSDVSVPSQHTINGHRYDAEVMLTHYYSVDKHDRLIGNVAIMLEKGSPKDRYDFLDLYLHQWERTANKLYRKCFPPDQAAKLQSDLSKVFEDEEQDFLDEQISDEHDLDDDFPLHNPRFQKEPSQPRRVSKDYYDREWHPYDWYVKANTEFYFRYEGSMPEPPCLEGVHWRVLSSPIKVAPSQLRALHYLLKHRLDPDTCEYDTYVKLSSFDERQVEANRPTQKTSNRHRVVYCECSDWDPKGEKDKAFCKLSAEERGVFDTSVNPSSVPTVEPSDVPSSIPTSMSLNSTI